MLAPRSSRQFLSVSAPRFLRGSASPRPNSEPRSKTSPAANENGASEMTRLPRRNPEPDPKLLLSQREVYVDLCLHLYGLAIQQRRLILPLPYRLQCRGHQ
jgi:hypothetical protein